jgi:hypothetical protein
MVKKSDESRILTWHPVEPTLTHCVDIRSIELDFKSERNSEGLRDDDFETLKSAPEWLWQQIVMTIVAQSMTGNPPERILFDTEITFRNVIMFYFNEFEFRQGSVIDHLMSEHGDSIYDKGGLSRESGFFLSGDSGNSVGEFCLWVCDNSPIVGQFAQGWKPWTSLDERLKLFRHYRITSDDLGSFHIVCTQANVRRLDADSSGDAG